nr:hypothetical protein [Parabacteroides goldsteinii]
MKHSKHILLPFVILLLLAGCTKEELPDITGDTSGITVNLRVADPLPDGGEKVQTTLFRSVAGSMRTGRITTRSASLDPLPGESLITNAYVLFYTKNATESTPAAAFQSATGLNSEAGCSIEFDHSLLTQLTAGSEYDIFVLASLPASTPPPYSGMTKGEFMALNEQQFERSTAAPGISFFGHGSFRHDKGNRKTFNIEISRTVARLDITVSGIPQKDGIVLRIIDQAATVPYYPGGTVTTPVRYYKNEVVSGAHISFYRFYVYPNYTGGNEYGKARLYLSTYYGDVGTAYNVFEPVLINNGTIERNKIYEISCVL